MKMSIMFFFPFYLAHIILSGSVFNYTDVVL